MSPRHSASPRNKWKIIRVSQIIQAQADIMKKAGGGGAGAPEARRRWALEEWDGLRFLLGERLDGVENLTVTAAAAW